MDWKTLFAIASCICIPVVAPAQETIAGLRERMEAQVEDLETDALRKQSDLANKYAAALETLEKGMEATGDLDGVLHVREERSAVLKDGRTTLHRDKALVDLRGRYVTATEAISAELAAALGRLELSFGQEVRQQVVSLTKAGDLDGALAFRKEGEAMIQEISRGKVTADFFGIGVKARRVAYVIDFSMSMRADGREGLMRKELMKSVAGLPDGTRYQLIFFSGPVWTAGDRVATDTVIHAGVKYRWKMKNLWEWVPEGPLMKAEWLEADETRRNASINQIRNEQLVGGTDWGPPLRMAMEMNPPPEEIFFMTDGIMEKRDMKLLAQAIAADARPKGVKIHTINMMVEDVDAGGALGIIAGRTGGSVVKVEKDGRVSKPGP